MVKVLLIDESALRSQLVARVLSKEPDVEVRLAESVEEAISVAEELLPTVAVRALSVDEDPCLPDLERLKTSPSTRDVPVVVLSDSDDPALRQQMLDGGAADFALQADGSAELVDKLRRESSRYLASMGRAPQPSRVPGSFVPTKVFMIDDSPLLCMACERRLVHLEEVVFGSCTEPLEALDRARAFGPSVILLDLEMPDLNGFELLPLLKGDPLIQDVPVIVLSGIDDPSIKARVFGLGADDYAEKQMDQVELESRIRHHSLAFRNATELKQVIADLVETQKRLELQRDFVKRTFGRYLSEEVVDQILETPEGLELGGEKRVISVMMADLRGFTSMSEGLEPEQVLAILNNFLMEMTEVIFRFDGTIDEFLGDAILCMFGAPVQRADDAERAVACAVAMQLRMAEVNEWNRARGYPPVAMGVGINTGEVVVGNIGSERRAKYGIVGANVNLTSRIEACTVGGQIMVSETTVAACGDILRIDSQRKIKPKGVEHPVGIFEVGGIGGRHGLSLPEKLEQELRPLVEPVPVEFWVLKSKRATGVSHSGVLVRRRGDTAELESNARVDKLSDLKIRLFDVDGHEMPFGIYGKVVESGGGGRGVLRVQLTVLPPEAASFLDLLMAGGPEESACR